MTRLSPARHWAIAALLGLLIGVLAYNWTIARTPAFLMDRAFGRVTENAPVNAMAFAPLANDQARAIVRPSPDLAYASCAFDVSKGPVVVEALQLPAPYWSLSVFDGQTNAVFVRNNRQSQGQAVRIAIVQPGVAAPAGYEPVPVSGARGIALIRALVVDRAQFPALDAARRLSNCRSIAVE